MYGNFKGIYLYSKLSLVVEWNLTTDQVFPQTTIGWFSKRDNETIREKIRCMILHINTYISNLLYI